MLSRILINNRTSKDVLFELDYIPCGSLFKYEDKIFYRVYKSDEDHHKYPNLAKCLNMAEGTIHRIRKDTKVLPVQGELIVSLYNNSELSTIKMEMEK